MGEDELVALLKCLADRSRLRIVRALAAEDLYVELLSERLALAPSTVSFHLRKLGGGIVSSYRTQYYVMYALNRDKLDHNLLVLVSASAGDEGEQERREEAYRQRVIDSFFEYGCLTAIPRQRKKKRIVLEVAAERFEPGRVYSSARSTTCSRPFTMTCITLRRDLVGRGLLARDARVTGVHAWSGRAGVLTPHRGHCPYFRGALFNAFVA